MESVLLALLARLFHLPSLSLQYLTTKTFLTRECHLVLLLLACFWRAGAGTPKRADKESPIIPQVIHWLSYLMLC